MCSEILAAVHSILKIFFRFPCISALYNSTVSTRGSIISLNVFLESLHCHNLVEAHCYGIGRTGQLLSNHVVVETD